MTDPIEAAMAASHAIFDEEGDGETNLPVVSGQAFSLPGLGNAMHDVLEFHLDFGHPAPNRPTMLSPERADARASWQEEEAQELRDAVTIAEQADAAIDGLYFNLGTLVELGLNPQPLWDIVQRANMAKKHMIDGVPTVVYFPEGHPKAGKVMKPDDWQDPKPLFEAEIARQIALADEPVYF